MKRSLSRPALAGRVLFSVAIAGAALAVGSVHTPVLCAVAALLAAALAFTWWTAEPIAVRPSATLLAGTALALIGYTLFQGVPLPEAVLAFIAPHNAFVWSRALTPLREAGPSWAPLSLDPIAGRVEVLKGVVYLLAFLCALRLARRRDDASFVRGVVVATGVILAFAALLHPAFGAHRLFGIYEPQEGGEGRHLAPLLDPNNLAGYLNVALCLALADVLAREPFLPRAIGGAVVLFLAGTQLWVASRGGVVAMGLGIFLAIMIARLRGGSAGALTVIVTLAFGLGVALVVLAGSDDASIELLDADASKLKLFGLTMHMFPAVPIFGCGRGAFESAFPAFREPFGGHVSIGYPENVVAQWLLEWGGIVGIAGLLAIAVALRPTQALLRSSHAAGAWAALAALSVQQLEDLGSEIPGLVLSGAVCAALVVAGSPRRRFRRAVDQWATFPRATAGVGVALAVVAIAMAAPGTPRELRADRLALHDAALARSSTLGEVRGLARAAMLRHPGEPYLPFIVSVRASTIRDENPMPWIEATLERSPVYAPAHLILARVVASRSPSQARLEYRLAYEQGPSLYLDIMAEAPRLVRSYSDAKELVPEGISGGAVLSALANSLAARLPATSVRLDADLLTRSPGDTSALLHRARDALADLSYPWCAEKGQRAGCVQRAVDAASAAAECMPRSCEPHAIHARAKAAGGDVASALSELDAAAQILVDRNACLEALVELAYQSGNLELSDQTLDRIAQSCAGGTDCEADIAWAAREAQREGQPQKALVIYRRLTEVAADPKDALEQTARLASSLGLHVEAAEDFERLARRQPSDGQWTRAAAAERQAALRVELAP